MRRRLNWAVLGTSGVLAVAVAALISTAGEPEEAASPKIIVPMADGAVIDVPPPATPRPSTVFIDVPPVAVTSEAVVPPPSPEQPAVAAPKKVPPATKPVVPVPPVTVSPVKPQVPSQSIWDMYSAYRNYYGSGYDNGGRYYGGSGYYGGYNNGGYYDSGRGYGGYGGRDGGRR